MEDDDDGGRVLFERGEKRGLMSTQFIQIHDHLGDPVYINIDCIVLINTNTLVLNNGAAFDIKESEDQLFELIANAGGMAHVGKSAGKKYNPFDTRKGITK